MRKRLVIQYGVSVCILVMLLEGAAVGVLQPVPEESGVSGFVNIGAAYLEVKTNMISGNKLVTIGDDTIDSILGSPDTEYKTIPILNGEVVYTFGDSRTQIYLGNQLEDVLQFDTATLLGVRKELGDKGTAAVSYVFSGIATEVWEDPYVANAKRDETDRNSNGIRLEWDRLYGSNFGVQYQWRKIDIDDELSGTLGGLGLTPAQVSLLDREGDHHRGDVYYTWRLGGGHALVPAFRYGKHDLDGDAMASDVYAFRLNYAFRSEKYSIVVTGSVGTEDFDERNPIYGRTREDDVYGIGVTGFLHQPFGLPEGFSLAGTVGYYEADSNIDFYNAQAFMVGTSILYKF
ncbi:MAG: DUF2860 family protein [Planctomycetota bacterium]